MLKIDINRDKERSIIECSGAGDEMVAELAMVVGHVYAGIHSNSPEMAAAFKHIFTMLVAMPDSPVWQADKVKMADGSYCTVVPMLDKDDADA